MCPTRLEPGMLGRCVNHYTMQSLTKLHDVLTNINVVTDSLTVQTRPDPTVRINRYIFKTFKSFFPRYYINQAHELTPVVPHASGS